MSSNPQPGISIRGLYTPPQEEWLFLPPNVNLPGGGAHGSGGVGGSTGARTTTGNSNYEYNFSTPSIPLANQLNEEDVSLSSLLTPYTLLQIFASEYLTTALGMPFEVGKTLLQVEYKPRKGVLSAEEERAWEVQGDGVEDENEDEEEDENSRGDPSQRSKGANKARDETEITNPEEAEQYFTDLLSASDGARYHHDDSSSSMIPGSMEEVDEIDDPFVKARQAGRDEEGYLPEPSSSYLIKSDVSPSGSSGVWGMMRRIRRTPSEGLPALWKGQLLTTVHSLLSSNIQPFVHSFMILALPARIAMAEINAELSLPLSSHPHPALPLGLHVASHLLTHMFLSPLEVLRTRVIVQPSSALDTKSSPALLKEMIEHEGGIKGIYTDSRLLIPALLEHTIRPILTLSIPLLIERQLNISPDISPVAHSILDLSLGLASLLVVLPIETVRKRLQLQDRASAAAAYTKSRRNPERKSVVRLRKKQYVGVVEAMWRIITEETAVSSKSGRSRRKALLPEVHPGRLDGIKQLYRGFGIAAGAHLTVFALGLVSAGLGGRTLEYGWKEI